jgi:predicted choloylglycine hydrolase
MNLINTKDTMVSVIDYKTVKTEAGKEFNLLVVQGGVQPLVSAKTGRIYLTMRKANVSTTFADASCKSLIGTELRGSIKKVSCDPYDYTIHK